MCRVAMIDSDTDFMIEIARYLQPKLKRSQDSLVTFKYPEQIDEFNKRKDEFEVVLVDWALGSENGAGLARELFAENIKASLVIVSKRSHEQYDRFDYFMSRDAILKDPSFVLSLPYNELRQATEMTVLAESVSG